MYTFFKKSLLLFLFFVCDIFYFFCTTTLFLHLTLCCSLYFLFHEYSKKTILIVSILLALLGSTIYHSYTIYFVSILPWATSMYLIRHYMGRKDFYICLLLLCTLVTHTVLLYYSDFKPIITLPYTFSLISCNLIVLYMVIVRFPIVE